MKEYKQSKLAKEILVSRAEEKQLIARGRMHPNVDISLRALTDDKSSKDNSYWMGAQFNGHPHYEYTRENIKYKFYRPCQELNYFQSSSSSTGVIICNPSLNPNEYLNHLKKNLESWYENSIKPTADPVIFIQYTGDGHKSDQLAMHDFVEPTRAEKLALVKVKNFIAGYQPKCAAKVVGNDENAFEALFDQAGAHYVNTSTDPFVCKDGLNALIEVAVSDIFARYDNSHLKIQTLKNIFIEAYSSSDFIKRVLDLRSGEAGGGQEQDRSELYQDLTLMLKEMGKLSAVFNKYLSQEFQYDPNNQHGFFCCKPNLYISLAIGGAIAGVAVPLITWGVLEALNSNPDLLFGKFGMPVTLGMGAGAGFVFGVILATLIYVCKKTTLADNDSFHLPDEKLRHVAG
ncbi:MAG: hypothetical protein QM752_07065 [Gammaproteobacteria bacterium]